MTELVVDHDVHKHVDSDALETGVNNYDGSVQDILADEVLETGVKWQTDDLQIDFTDMATEETLVDHTNGTTTNGEGVDDFDTNTHEQGDGEVLTGEVREEDEADDDNVGRQIVSADLHPVEAEAEESLMESTHNDTHANEVDDVDLSLDTEDKPSLGEPQDEHVAAHNEIDEIDYEQDDQLEILEPEEEKTVDEASSHVLEDSNSEFVEATNDAEVSLKEQEQANPGSNEAPANDEDEITWEADQPEPTPAANHAEAGEPVEDAAAHPNDVSLEKEDGEEETREGDVLHDEYAGDDLEHEDYAADVEEPVQHVDEHTQSHEDEVLEEGSEPHAVAQDFDLSPHGTSASDATQDFPYIKVQYKGEEYSLFADGPDGFFSDLAVLDQTIESLLAGFRKELTDEISAEDDICFQIDELGLEFSESQSPEILSNITLRQITEIFELLVKNQDPDKSRQLYTYLLLKPSPSKRLEALLEYATTGKGLDEVIHIFGNPLPHEALALMSHSAMDEDEQDEFDSHDSAVEEEFERAEEEEEDVSMEQYPENGHEDAEVGINGYEAQEFGEGDPIVGEPEVASSTAVERSDLLTGDNIDDVDYDLRATPQPEPNEAGDEIFEKTQDQAADSAQFDINTTDAEIQTDFSLEAGAIESEPIVPKPDEELLVDDFSVEDTATAAVVEDELDEIDWRDEAEIAEENHDAAAVASKRPRVDDEVGVENDQDAKRRRS